MAQSIVAGYQTEELSSILVVTTLVAVLMWFQADGLTSAVIGGLAAFFAMAIGIRLL